MKNIIYLSIAFLSFQFQFLAQESNTKSSNIAEHYFTTSYNVAIFPESYNPFGFKKTFTPTELEVDQAEKALSRDLMLLNKERIHQTRDFVIHKKLMRFKRQYFGFYDENDEKVILINAFYSSRTSDPYKDRFLKELIDVKNGGSKYWKVKYNLEKNILKDLEINDKGKVIEKPIKTQNKEIKKIDNTDEKTIKRDTVNKIPDNKKGESKLNK